MSKPSAAEDGGDFTFFTQVVPEDVNDEQIPQPQAVDLGLAPKHPFRMVVTGASGQGKTTVANHLLSKVYKGYFDKRIMFSPTAEWDPSWKSAKFKKSEIKEELDPDLLFELYEEQEEKCKKDGAAKSPRVLLMFDDCIADLRFMHSPEMLKLFVQGRHCNISLMMLTQSYMKVDRSCRLQATDILFFPSNLSEVDRLVKEHCPPNCSGRQFKNLVMHATRKKHDFLNIGKRLEESEKFKRNFDTILEISGDTGFVDPDRRSRKRRRKKEAEAPGEAPEEDL
jgi:hypothetical protein